MKKWYSIALIFLFVAVVFFVAVVLGVRFPGKKEVITQQPAKYTREVKKMPESDGTVVYKPKEGFSPNPIRFRGSGELVVAFYNNGAIPISLVFDAKSGGAVIGTIPPFESIPVKFNKKGTYVVVNKDAPEQKVTVSIE